MYNATAYKYGVRHGKTALVSREAVEVDADGRVIRACGFWSAWNGKPEFEEMWRNAQFSFITTIRVVQDGAAGYREAIARIVPEWALDSMLEGEVA